MGIERTPNIKIVQGILRRYFFWTNMLEYCIVSKNMVILPGRVKPPFGRQKAPFGRVKAPFQKLKKMVFPQQPWPTSNSVKWVPFKLNRIYIPFPWLTRKCIPELVGDFKSFGPPPVRHRVLDFCNLPGGAGRCCDDNVQRLCGDLGIGHDFLTIWRVPVA